MNLQGVEQQRKKINRSVYGLLSTVIIIFGLILFVFQLQKKEASRRDVLLNEYHLAISKISFELLSKINEARLWFRDNYTEQQSGSGAINQIPPSSPLRIGLSGRDQIYSLKYEIDKLVREINQLQEYFADTEFNTISVLLHQENIKFQAGLDGIQSTNNYSQKNIDTIATPLVAVTHQLQRLHQFAYQDMRLESEFNKQKNSLQLVGLIAVLTIMGIFGVARLLRHVQQNWKSLSTAQDELQVSEQNFSSLTENMLDGVLVNVEGKLVFANTSMAKLLGYEKVEELIGTTFEEILQSDQRQAVLNQFQLRMKGIETDSQYETTFITKTGDPLPVEINTATTLWQGTKAGMVTVRNITERKVVTDKLRETSLLLDSIVENVPNMIFLKRASDLRFEFFNCAGETMMGLARAELLGRNDYDFFPKDQADFFIGKDRQVLAQHGVVDIPEEVIETPLGNRILHTQKIAIRDEQGRAQYLLGISEDITERRYAEVELDKYRLNLEELVKMRTTDLVAARDEAERANTAKSDFLSRMSHELRTPMNAILGFGQILELDTAGLNGSQRECVEEILAAGHHLLKLINEVLDLARIESGKLEVCMEKVYVDDLLRQCITMIQPLAASGQVELIDHIYGKGYTVLADFTRFKQVMLNFLSNAVKYNRKHGQIILSSEINDGQHLRICVTDTGPGLSEEQVVHLFSDFERLSGNSNIEGTGIGLVISKHLTELMGGTIGVDSTPGEGSTFWMELGLSNDAQSIEA